MLGKELGKKLIREKKKMRDEQGEDLCSHEDNSNNQPFSALLYSGNFI